MPGEVRLGSSAGKVFNVLGKLKGTEPGGRAVLLVSHYDSVMTGPGAADDGAAVACMLAVAEKLKFLEQHKIEAHRNDIIFLFTDAEEVCLCGAKAFVEQHRWAKDVGLVLNFEARGNSGPSIMFETSDGNAELIRAFASFAPSPVTNSLTYEVYKRLPNDTDMTIFKRAGYPGLNFAFIGGLKYYHSPEDTPANISTMSIAHHGNNMLAAARYFGNADLDRFKPGGPNAVYFDFGGRFIVRYSETAARILCLLGILLSLGSLTLAVRHGTLTLRALLLQMALAFVLTLLACALAWLLMQAYARLLINLLGLPKLDVLTSKSALLALLAACSLPPMYLLRRWRTRALLLPGSSLWFLLLSPLTTFLIPGASWLFTWPLICVSIAGLILHSPLAHRHPTAAAIPVTLLMIPVIFLVGGTLNGVFTAMTIGMLPVQAFLAFLLLLPLAMAMDIGSTAQPAESPANSS